MTVCHLFVLRSRLCSCRMTGHYPVSYVCYRKRSVIADVLTAWLLRVTAEVFLFVSPRGLSRRSKHQDTEDKQDG